MTTMDVEMTEMPLEAAAAGAVESALPTNAAEGKRKRRASEEDNEFPDAKRMRPTKLTKVASRTATLMRKCDPPATLESDLKRLCDFYPQCEQKTIQEKLNTYKDDAERVYKIAQEIEEEFGYPSWVYKPPNTKAAYVKELLDIDAHFDDLVLAYDDLDEEYHYIEKEVSENYKDHVVAQLEFEFPRMRLASIRKVAGWYNYHFLPTYTELKAIPSRSSHAKGRKGRIFENNQPEYPKDLDHSFFKELLFAKNFDKIRDEAEKIEEERTKRLNELKAEGQLQTCGCCCEEEILPEDLLECPSGHQFCKRCIGRSTDVIVGQARGKVPCLNNDCKTYYTVPVIKKSVKPKIFSLFVRRFQEEELQEAGIEDLVTCPFCDYATIIEDPNVTVLKCFNPFCMKESCRLCKEPNHMPLHCSEAAEQKEVGMRANIENKMSEAMMRSCYKCKKRFLRTDGCPMMTCVCGARMCYICRKRITKTHRGCRNESSEDLHKREVAEAYWEARNHYLSDFTNVDDLLSKHGIDKLLEAPPTGDTAQVPVLA